MNRFASLLFSCLVCLLLFAGPLAAVASPVESEPVHPAVEGEEPPDTGWTFSAGLYLWLTSMSGDLMVRDRDLSINLSFSDLVNASDTLEGDQEHEDYKIIAGALDADPRRGRGAMADHRTCPAL
jgi:hypothetical protein